jgi:hypothetical protein
MGIDMKNELETNEPGILALWNDCAPDGEAEYERWYMGQHLPERVGVPGFQFGRRYTRVDGDRKFFTFYELDAPDVLWSPKYLERLGNPTDWTQRVMLDFRNTIRTACRKLGSVGTALGGHAVTFRFMSPKAPGVNLEEVIKSELLPVLMARDGICQSHIWIAAEEQTPANTAETDLRGEDELMSWAVIAETTRVEEAMELTRDTAFLERLGGLDPANDPIVGIYQLMAVLTSQMMQADGENS